MTYKHNTSIGFVALLLALVMPVLAKAEPDYYVGTTESRSGTIKSGETKFFGESPKLKVSLKNCEVTK